MTPTELEDLLEQLATDVENFASTSAAARALRDGALRGEDLEPAVPVLTRTLHEATQVPVLEPAAAALALHLLNRGEPERLLEVMGRVRWASYLGDALRALAERGRDLGPVLPALVPPPGRRPRALNLLRVLRAHVGVARERLAATAELLAERDPALLEALLKDCLFGSAAPDVTAALPWLLPRMEGADVEGARSATEVVYRAAVGDCDFTSVAAALERLLGAPDDEVRRNVAYALAAWAVRRGDGAGLDALRRHGDAVVRREAAHALCGALNEGAPDLDPAARLAEALLDEAAPVRARAGACLASAHAKGLAAVAPAPVLDALVRGLGREEGRPDVLAYLSLVAAAAPEVAARLAPGLAAAAAADDPSVARLRDLCDRAAAGVADVPCRGCAHLPRSRTWHHEGDAPPGVAALVPCGPALCACPGCGAVFQLEHEVEHEDMTSSETWDLKRLSPTAALGRLQGEPLARLRERYDALVARARARLDHPLAALRDEGAWALVEHAASVGAWDEVRAVLARPEPDVRLAAVTALDGLHLQRPDRELPLDLLAPCLRDAEPGVRRKAAGLVAREALRRGLVGAATDLLGAADEVVAGAAAAELARARSEGADLGPFVGALLPLASHAAPAVRRAATQALDGAPMTPDQRRRLVAAFQARLGGRTLEERNEGAGLLLAALEAGADVTPALPAVIALLRHPKTVSRASRLLRAAAQRGLDVAPALDVVAEGLASSRIRGHADLAGTLDAMARAGVDVRPALPAMVRLVVRGPRDQGDTLVILLSWLHEQGVDLAPFVDDLEGALPRLQAWQRERVAPALLAAWLSQGAWARLGAFVRARHGSTEHCVCAALCEAVARGVDVGAVAADLVGELASRNAIVRGYPVKALRAHFARFATARDDVVAALRRARRSPERDGLLAELDPTWSAVPARPARRGRGGRTGAPAATSAPGPEVHRFRLGEHAFFRIRVGDVTRYLGLLRALPAAGAEGPWPDVYAEIAAFNARHDTAVRLPSLAFADWLLVGSGAAALVEGFAPFPCDAAIAYEAPGRALGATVGFAHPGSPLVTFAAGPHEGSRDVALLVERLGVDDFVATPERLALAPAPDRVRLLSPFPAAGGWFEPDPATALPTGWPDTASDTSRRLRRAEGAYVGPVCRGLAFGGFGLDDRRHVLAGTFAARDRYAIVVEAREEDRAAAR